MFAPPNVANAKTAQALQAVASQFALRDQNQQPSTNVSTPRDGIVLRKKSDPVLSKSAPSSTQDFIQLDREKTPSTPTTLKVLDGSPAVQTLAASSVSVNCNASEAELDFSKEIGSNNFAQIDGTQDSITQSSSSSAQTSKNVSSKVIAQSATPVDSAKKKNKKNRKGAWYSLISSTYKTKCEDFRRLFKDVPQGEMLIVDYSCALQRDILFHGRLYVTQNYLCFRSNIFGWETTVVIKCKDITSMTKEKTALVIPNAIQCSTEKGDRYFFASFAARDKSYLMLFRLWQNALLKQPMSTAECWRWIHYSYGDELGLSTDDEDYIPPDDLATCRSIDIKNFTEPPVEEAEMARPPSASEISSAASGVKTSAMSSSPVSDPDLESSSSDDLEVGGEGCPSSHHTKKYLDRSFALDIDHTFTCLFTASEFYQEFQNGRKVSNVAIGNWKPSENADVKQERVLTYSLNVSLAMAKNCVTTERQKLHRRSKPGKLYSVDCEYSNSGVPYADSFVVNQHVCLEKEGHNRCRLKVFSEIEYRKQVWGLMKGIIERNTVQGTNEFVSDLQKALDKEASRLANERGQSLPILPDADVTELNSGFVEREQTKSREIVASPICGTQRSLVIFLCIAVAVLLMLNVYFIHRSFGNELNVDDVVDDKNVPNTAAGWKNAYFRNQVRHQRQLEDLQRLVDRSLQGLENMKVVFTKVKEIVAQKVVAIPLNSKTEL